MSAFGRYLNKNIDDFEAACKSLEILERFYLVNFFTVYTLLDC